MRSVAVAASSLAFVASVTAQVPGFAAMSAPAKGEQVPAGSTYTIRWEAGQYTGNVEISLLGGETPETLQNDGVIASSVRITDESYNWNVDCQLGEMATYGLQITSVDDPATFQYSFPFHIDNSNCGASGGESSSSMPTEYPTSAPPVSSSTISVTMTGYPTSSPPKPTQSVTEEEPEIPSATSSYEAVPTEQPTTQSTTQPPTASTTLMTSASVTSAFTESASATTSVEPIATAAAGRNAVSLAAIGGVVAAVFAL